MSEIQRYDVTSREKIKAANGKYVLFTDHEAALAEKEERITLLEGTIQADDERLLKAAEKAGIAYMGCDTADWLAETVKELRAEERIKELEAENGRLRSALDNCLETLTYVRQYFDGQGLSAFDDINDSIEKARDAMAGEPVCPKCGGVGTFSSEGCLEHQFRCVKCGHVKIARTALQPEGEGNHD